jgi:hypothetical protein
MRWIDERGRLFGRVNLVDALVTGLVVVLFPLAYAGYLLFRTPPPRLHSIEPTTIRSAPNERIHVRGENFRPYLRITFDTKKAKSFLLADFSSAEVGVPELAPGRYDVALYDEAKELARLPEALTVVAPSVVADAYLRVVGKFRGVPRAEVEPLATGLKLTDQSGVTVAEILGTAAPQHDERWVDAGETISVPVLDTFQVPATLRVACVFDARRCNVGDKALGPRVVIDLPGPKGHPVTFYIEDVRPDRDPVDVDAEVRFLTNPAVASLVRAGDRDTAGVTDPVALAWLVGSAAVRPMAGESSVETEIAGATIQRFRAAIPESMAVVDVLVHIRAEETPLGWRFKGQLLRVGASLTFDSGAYVMRGSIRSLKKVARALPPLTN